MSEQADPRSLPEIVSAVSGDIANLVRKESELVRTEVKESLHAAGRAGIMVSAGAALLIGAFLVLLQAVVLALSKFMDPLWASIVVGVVVALIGFSLVRAGANKVRPENLAPDRAMRQVRKDAQLVKEQTQ